MSALILLALLAQQPEDLPAKRDRLAARVEEIRGLKYRAPVALREGTRKEYAAVAVENAKLVYGEDLSACERALKALGLIGGFINLEKTIQMYALQGAQAYQKRDEVALVNASAGDDEIVFRLTSALSEQAHGLAAAAKKIGPHFDAQMAFAAMRQGDADMTKQLFWASRKLDEKLPDDHLNKLVAAADKWERETSRFASMAVARLFVRGADFGYRRGGIFMETVRRRGGMAAVEKVYERPPLSTEQVLHPDKYFAGERPVAIDPGPVDEFLAGKGYKRVWSTTLGELGTAIVVETHLKEDTGKVAPGWGGDVFLYYEDTDRKPLAVWATAWDGEADALEFQGAAFKVLQVLGSSDPKALNLALRRRASVGVLLNVPTAIKDDAEDALWKCAKRAGDRTEPYGQD